MRFRVCPYYTRNTDIFVNYTVCILIYLTQCCFISASYDPCFFICFFFFLIFVFFSLGFFSFLHQNILIEPVWWCISQFVGFDLHLVNNFFYLDQLSVTFSFFSVTTSVSCCDWFSILAQMLLYVLISNKKNTCFQTGSEICPCSSSFNLYLRLPFKISLTTFTWFLNWIPLSIWLWLP